MYLSCTPVTDKTCVCVRLYGSVFAYHGGVVGNQYHRRNCLLSVLFVTESGWMGRPHFCRVFTQYPAEYLVCNHNAGTDRPPCFTFSHYNRTVGHVRQSRCNIEKANRQCNKQGRQAIREGTSDFSYPLTSISTRTEDRIWNMRHVMNHNRTEQASMLRMLRGTPTPFEGLVMMHSAFQLMRNSYSHMLRGEFANV